MRASRLRWSLVLLAAISLTGQQQQQKTMSIEEYDPKSTLVVPQTKITRAKFPFLDVHHHPRMKNAAEVDALVKDMDALNMRVLVNLSGGTGAKFQENIDLYKKRYPDRFIIFANMDFSDIDAPDFADRVAARYEADVKAGAQGLKIFKNFGMDLKDKTGERVHVDDPRFDKIFELCGKLKTPVLIHTAEPKAFFDPIDKNNERWLELKQFPQRARPSDRYPSWNTLMEEQRRMFKKHPNTIFINAHLGWLGGDLAELAKRLDEMPNMYTEVAAAIYELGRQPKFARQFLLKYSNRVLMGKDAWEPRDPAEYWCYFRVFETGDEYFDYFRRRHAFWKMYGLELPDDALRNIYYRNAAKIILGVKREWFEK
jgi:predicted TIM-barrel fold metal-dependent hydrolase